MSQLQLSLLGEPLVIHGETTLTLSTRKALALLVYLAVEGGTHPRKTLSESFWPELDAQHGRAALRATLLELRKPRFTLLASQRFNPAPELLAGRLDEAQVQEERAALIESKHIALNQQVSPLAWSVTALEELAQLEQGSA